jgi:hypothetical protein
VENLGTAVISRTRRITASTNDGHGKHDDNNNKMGMWQRGGSGKDFRREWLAGGVAAGSAAAGVLATSAKARFTRAYGTRSLNRRSARAMTTSLSTNRKQWARL